MSRPGLGTVVGEPPGGRSADRRKLLREEAERLVVEAMRVGLDLPEVIESIEEHWFRLQKPAEVRKPEK